MAAPDVFEGYSVSLLRCGDHFLLLQRDQHKAFAPGRWTGLGGHIEPHEYGGLVASGLREVAEEAHLNAEDISRYRMRRALFAARPGQPLRLIFYFTGSVAKMLLPDCDEGGLAWLRQDRFDALDIIETTRPVLDCLIDDMQRDPDGLEAIHAGMAIFNAEGKFQKIIWGL